MIQRRACGTNGPVICNSHVHAIDVVYRLHLPRRSVLFKSGNPETLLDPVVYLVSDRLDQLHDDDEYRDRIDHHIRLKPVVAVFDG